MKLIKVDTTYEPVVILSLNRPEKRNALNAALINQFCYTFENITSDPQTRVVILKGEGAVFCAGLDLHEAQEAESSGLSGEMVAKLFRTVYSSPCPTIALVHGAALAGGAGLMAGCDFVIAEENTVIGFPETRKGLVPALIMPLLMRRMSVSDLSELLFFEEEIDAQKAFAMKLVNRVVNHEGLMSEALYYAEKVMQGAPEATRKTKALLEKFYTPNFSECLDCALKFHFEARGSHEAREGIAAFIEKRKPNWANS